jgi:GntR family transcriptional repressor for pyruvate dehydrogenase complex
MPYEPEDVFRSIVKTKATETVVQRVQELIIDSRLVPGDVLPSERELASRLAVSRNALREALGVLQQKGLVAIVAGRGTYVARLGSIQIKDSLELLLKMGHVNLLELSDARQLIEPELARLAAGRGRADKVALSARLDDLRQSADDNFRHVEADLDFHAEIALLAGHGVYEAFANAIREPVTRSMIFGVSVPRAIDVSDEQHRAIHDAILLGDGDEAARHMKAHLAYVRGYIAGHERKTV